MENNEIYDKLELAFRTITDEMVRDIDDPMMLLMMVAIQIKVMQEFFGEEELSKHLVRQKAKLDFEQKGGVH